MSWLDRARGAYVRSPKFLRQGLRPLMGLVPAKLKFGRTYLRERERVARAEADPKFAAEAQLAALRALFAKAQAGSPFYRDLIARTFGAEFDANVLELADLSKMPIFDKVALRSAGKDALAVPLSDVDWGETSGSNAETPFGFYLDKDRSTREMAYVYDVWSRIGFSENDARVCLRGFALDPNGRKIHDWDPALREMRLSVYPLTEQDAAQYLDLIDARGLQYIYGYPSAIELFCRQMRVLGRTPKRPIKGIMPISEPIFEHQRSFIIQTLGNPQFSCFYGLSEKVLFAAEVAGAPGVYEFNPIYGLAELVDEAGDPVTEFGKEGRLIGTGFLSTGMPFIRYETGDYARLVQLPNASNGQRMQVCDLTPRRKPNYLVTDEGTRVVTTDLTPEDPRFFAGISEFQFYQDTPGDVVIRYVTTGEGGPEDAARMAADLTRTSQNRLRFRPQPVSQIVAGRSGKRAFIDQRLDIGRY